MVSWEETLRRANDLVATEVHSHENTWSRMLAAGIVLVVEAIGELRDVVPHEPIQVSDVTPKYPRE